MSTVKTAAEVVAKATQTTARIFNPSNDVIVQKLNEKFLLKERDTICGLLQNDSALDLFLGSGHADWIKAIQSNPTSPQLGARTPTFWQLIRLSWVQSLYGKTSMFTQLVDEMTKNLTQDYSRSSSTLDKRLVFQTLAFLKHASPEQYYKVKKCWPSNLEKMVAYSADYHDYYRLYNRLKVPTENKLLFSHSLIDCYLVPLVLIDLDTKKPAPVLLMDTQNQINGNCGLMMESFIQLLLIREHFKPATGWICTYDSQKQSHIKNIASELNKQIGLVV